MFGLPAAGLGALIGAAFDRWRTVDRARSGPSSAALLLKPLDGRRFAAGASVTF